MALIYHLISPQAAQESSQSGTYSGDTLATEGFIHCSKDYQVLEVANRIFLKNDELSILTIDEDKVNPEIKYENLEGGEEMYPHIYGPLNWDSVLKIEKLEKEDSGNWSWTSSS